MKNLLLLHGAIGAKDQLDSLRGRLKESFDVYSFSFSGHGKVDFSQDFSVEQFTEDTLSFMSSKGLERVSIFGYSMGGYVALNLAKRHPDKVSQITTLGTKFKWTTEITVRETKMLNPEIIEAKIPAFASALQERHGSNWKTMLSKTAHMMLEMGEKNPLSLSDYAEIKQSCKLLLADNDEMVSKDETLAVNERLPNSSFSLLPNSKHPIEKVDIDFLVEEILKMA